MCYTHTQSACKRGSPHDSFGLLYLQIHSMAKSMWTPLLTRTWNWALRQTLAVEWVVPKHSVSELWHGKIRNIFPARSSPGMCMCYCKMNVNNCSAMKWYTTQESQSDACNMSNSPVLLHHYRVPSSASGSNVTTAFVCWRHLKMGFLGWLATYKPDISMCMPSVGSWMETFNVEWWVALH